MKKHLLVALIGATLLTACNDKSAETVQQQVQQITQLTEQLAQAKQHQALMPQRETLFNQSEPFRLKNDTGEQGAEIEVSIYLSTQKTGLDWLDKLLQDDFNQRVYALLASLDENPAPMPALPLNQIAAQYYAKAKQYVIENELGSYLLTAHLSYISQRGNIATFQFDRYFDIGGGQGSADEQYINVDLAEKKILQLNDLFPDENKLAEVKDWLWQTYREQMPHLAVDEVKKDFFVSPNFYFDPQGVHFVYYETLENTRIELVDYWWNLDRAKQIDPKFVPVVTGW